MKSPQIVACSVRCPDCGAPPEVECAEWQGDEWAYRCKTRLAHALATRTDLKWYAGYSQFGKVHWVSEVGPTLCGIQFLVEWDQVDLTDLMAQVPWCYYCERKGRPPGRIEYAGRVPHIPTGTGWSSRR